MPGTNRLIGSSQRSFPSSTSMPSATAVKSFVLEAVISCTVPPCDSPDIVATRDIWNGVKARPPGNRLHALGGDLRGFHAVRVNDQYRMVFRFEGADAFDVRCTDYH